jgi:hypothetical protein
VESNWSMWGSVKSLVFQPIVWSLVTLGYELNRSGVCHGSLVRSNRVTFYPKKESLSKNHFSLLPGIHNTKLYTSTNLHQLPHLDGHATTPHYTASDEMAWPES